MNSNWPYLLAYSDLAQSFPFFLCFSTVRTGNAANSYLINEASESWMWLKITWAWEMEYLGKATLSQ